MPQRQSGERKRSQEVEHSGENEEHARETDFYEHRLERHQKTIDRRPLFRLAWLHRRHEESERRCHEERRI